MTMKRAVTQWKYAAPVSSVLGDRQIRVVASDATVDRVGDVLDPVGCDISNYLKNPVVLAQHDPAAPIGRASISISPASVTATITFAPVGASAKADEYCALAKAGVLSAVSVGFHIIEAEPIGRGGLLIRKWELQEISLVAVPCNPSALVVERSFGGRTAGKSGRVLSQANQDHLDAIAESLGKISNAHRKMGKHIGRRHPAYAGLVRECGRP